MGYTHGRHLQGWKNASASFQKELMACAKPVARYAQQIFVDSNEMFLDYVQAHKDRLPYYTGNLHDSIASVVSQRGRVVRAVYMPQEAKRPQNAPDRKRIVGMEEAIKAVRRQNYPQKAVASTLLVGVPYAEGANEKSKKGRGYLEWLEMTFLGSMEAGMQQLAHIKTSGGKYIPYSRLDFGNIIPKRFDK